MQTAIEFVDVLPGSYAIAETLKAGWFQTTSPSNPVNVAHGTDTRNLGFGNVEVHSSIDVEKSGPERARRGDTITYTITVRNSGYTTSTDVVVDDDKLGPLY